MYLNYLDYGFKNFLNIKRRHDNTLGRTVKIQANVTSSSTYYIPVFPVWSTPPKCMLETEGAISYNMYDCETVSSNSRYRATFQ